MPAMVSWRKPVSCGVLKDGMHLGRTKKTLTSRKMSQGSVINVRAHTHTYTQVRRHKYLSSITPFIRNYLSDQKKTQRIRR